MTKKQQRAKARAFAQKQKTYKTRQERKVEVARTAAITNILNTDSAFEIRRENNTQLYREITKHLKHGRTLSQAVNYTKNMARTGVIRTMQKNAEIQKTTVTIPNANVREGLAKILNQALSNREHSNYAAAGNYSQLRRNLATIQMVEPAAIDADLEDIWSNSKSYDKLKKLGDIQLNPDKLGNVSTSQLTDSLLSNFLSNESVKAFQEKSHQTWLTGNVHINGQECKLFGRELTADERNALDDILSRSDVWQVIKSTSYDSEQLVDTVEKFVEKYVTDKTVLDDLLIASKNNDINAINTIVKELRG